MSKVTQLRTSEEMSVVDRMALEYLEAYHAWLLSRAEYVDLVLVGQESAQITEAVRRIREGSL
jgi:hypothetical protein